MVDAHLLLNGTANILQLLFHYCWYRFEQYQGFFEKLTEYFLHLEFHEGLSLKNCLVGKEN